MATGVYIRTEKHRQALKLAANKRVPHPNSLAALRDIAKDRLGKKRTPFSLSWRLNISKAQTERFSNRPAPMKGKKNPKLTGSLHWNWKGGKKTKRLNSSVEWKNWREEVFRRDKHTCQECNIRGGYIEPHHIVPLRVTLSRAFEIKNGITLCRPCHLLTLGKEEHFIALYQAIVNAKL